MWGTNAFLETPSVTRWWTMIFSSRRGMLKFLWSWDFSQFFENKNNHREDVLDRDKSPLINHDVFLREDVFFSSIFFKWRISTIGGVYQHGWLHCTCVDLKRSGDGEPGLLVFYKKFHWLKRCINGSISRWFQFMSFSYCRRLLLFSYEHTVANLRSHYINDGCCYHTYSF